MTKVEFHRWQKEALKAWKDNGHYGTIKAATGTGKTYVGIASLYMFDKKPSTLIIVPTLHLQDQWKKELLRFGCPEGLIGFVGGGKHEWNKKFVIGVINSVLKSNKCKDHLILDEVHHYLSEKSIEIFKRDYKTLLGLTATPERMDQKHNYLFKIAPLVYEYNVDKAIRQDILAGFELEYVPLILDEGSRKLYAYYTGTISEGMRNYHDMAGLQRAAGNMDFEAINALRQIQKRRQLLLNYPAKIDKAVELIKGEIREENAKIIVFCEYIKTANKVKKLLDEDNISCGIYHSGLNKQEKTDFLESYKEGHTPIMIAVKSLDEGIDVPDTDVGIIIGGSSVKRQMIQRLGRLLRRKEGKTAKLFQIYIKDTKDEEWMRKRTAHLRQFENKKFNPSQHNIKLSTY